MHYRIFSHIIGLYPLDNSSSSTGVSRHCQSSAHGAESLLVEDHCSNPLFSLLLAVLFVCRSLSADKLQGIPKLGKRHLEYFPRKKCGKTVMDWITTLLYSLDHSETGKTKQNIQDECRQVVKEKCGLTDWDSQVLL